VNFASYAAGETIFSAGDVGDRKYAVKSGTVDNRVGKQIRRGRDVEILNPRGAIARIFR
jgi:CRP-like cAMP-binding protein